MDVRAHFFRFSLLALLGASLSLTACGGGGGGGVTGTVPGPGGGGGPSPVPTQTPVHTATPGPTASPTAGPTQTPIPAGNYESPAPASFMRTSYERIGDTQILDRYFDSDAQIMQEAANEDAVWGAFHPAAWNAGNPNIVNSIYITPQLDANRYHPSQDLTWWQNNHPDWILYACDPNGNLTHQLAYMPGLRFPDVPLNFGDKNVRDWMILQDFGPYMIANGYNAIAADNTNFANVMTGGNPNFGQSPISGYYACGTWQGNTPVVRYHSPSDPQYGTDVLNWLGAAKQYFASDPTLAPHHFHVLANHPIDEERFSDPNFQSLLANIDGIVDENGFSKYLKYVDSNGFINRVGELRAIQQRAKDVWIVNYFCVEPGQRTSCEASMSTQEIGYSIATYLMANEGNARLYANPVGDSYSYHPEYQTPTGPPCGEYTGSGPVFMRRFLNVLAVVNVSTSPQSVALPAGHNYTDIDHRTVTNPLQLQPHDGWVLQTTNGCN